MARVGFNLQVYSFFSSLYKRCIGKPITLLMGNETETVERDMVFIL